jgi:hypothetical protein
VVVQFHGFSSDNHPELKNAGVQIVVTSAPNPALSRAIATALTPRWHATTEADRLEGTTNVQRASTVSAGLRFVHVEVEYELRRADQGAEVARAVSDAICNTSMRYAEARCIAHNGFVAVRFGHELSRLTAVPA